MKGILGLAVLLVIGIAAYFLMGGGDDAPELTPAVETTEPETTEETVEETSNPSEPKRPPTRSRMPSSRSKSALETLQEEAEAAVEGTRGASGNRRCGQEQVRMRRMRFRKARIRFSRVLPIRPTMRCEGASNLAEDASDATEGAASRIQNALESALGEAADTDAEGGELTEEEMNANLEHDAPDGESDEILADAL